MGTMVCSMTKIKENAALDGPVGREGGRSPSSSLSDLGLWCTHDADNTVWCSTKFHDAAATNTISPIVT
jgi:hypothetical protein